MNKKYNQGPCFYKNCKILQNFNALKKYSLTKHKLNMSLNFFFKYKIKPTACAPVSCNYYKKIFILKKCKN